MLFVGIDIGGTFTDLALYDSDDGRTQVHKVRSTPDDPGRALVTGVLELCERAGHRAVEPRRRAARDDGRDERGPRAPTARGRAWSRPQGMRDVLHIGRHQRPEPYSVMQDIPWQTARSSSASSA